MEIPKPHTKWLQRAFFFSLICIQLPFLLGYRANTGAFVLGVLGIIVTGVQLIRKDAWHVAAPLLKKQVFWFAYALIGVAWLIWVGVKFYSMQIAVLDIGHFSNILHNLSRGSFYSSYLNIHALADHFIPSLALLAPLYALKSSLSWLVLAKVLAFLVCPYLLLKISRLILGGDSKWQYAIPLLWLFHEYLANTVLFEFQPSALALPLILLSVWCALKEREVGMWISLLLLLGLKEQMGFVWISMGIFLWWEKDRTKTGIAMVLMGIAAGILTWYVLMPAFGGGVINEAHQGRFGPFELIPQKINLLILCFLSVGALPLFAPWTVLFILPVFGLNLLSRFENMVGFGHHYQDIPLTFLMVGSIYGLRQCIQKDSLFKPFQGWLLLAGVISILMLNTKSPVGVIVKNWPTAEDRSLLSNIDEVRAYIPKKDQVWAPNKIGAYFYDYPEIQVIWLKHKDQKAPFTPLTKDSLHWIVLPKQAEWSGVDFQFLEQLADMKSKQQYRLQYQTQNLEVWKRTFPEKGNDI